MTDRFVSSEATGGGDGSIERPWTLAEAVANATKGDSIKLAGGVYLARRECRHCGRVLESRETCHCQNDE